MITITQTLSTQYIRDGKKFKSAQEIIDDLESTIETMKEQRDEAIDYIDELEVKVNELEQELDDIKETYYDEEYK